MSDVLHIAVNNKIIKSFISFVRKHISSDKQSFILYGGGDKFSCRIKDNIFELECNLKSPIDGLFRAVFIISKMYHAKKIVLHGLFDKYLLVLLFFQPWLLKKCYWVIWGSDLYYYKFEPDSYKKRINEIVRRFVIKRFAFLVTGTPGDVALAREWYKARGKHIVCFNYPSNVFNGVLNNVPSSDKKITIQVGNSGDPSNRHLDIFNKIKNEFKESTFLIYLPLAYGDEKYIRNVEEKAKEMFDLDVVIQKKLLPIDEYNKILSEVDIGIFAHRRQQAFGNIINLLGMGKTVYIDECSTLNEVLKKMKIEVYSFNSDTILLQPESISSNNSTYVKLNFSEEKLAISLNKWIL